MRKPRDQYALRSFAEALWDRIIRTLVVDKGDQYTSPHNALENFEQAAAIWETSVPHEILQFATKHWSFLVHWAKTGYARGRIGEKARESAWDMIVYMLLLLFLLQTWDVISVEEEKLNTEKIKEIHTSPMPDEFSPT
jgi:hypothetical protein